LTVLSCNLVRGTGAAAKLDPEEWRPIADQYRRAVSDAVARFAGYVAKGAGDNLIVYFGYPAAQEDAAERAVRAGLAIVEALAAPKAEFARTLQFDLTVRLGVHASAMLINRAGQEVEIFGEAPDVAARVQAAAEPDTVVMTGAVKDLVSGLFVVEEASAGLLD